MKNVLLKTLCLGLLCVFVSCNNDDANGFSKEQIAYFEENLDYIREKKALTDDEGNLIYQQVVVKGDTALYRVLSKDGDATTHPSGTSVVTMKLKGDLINGKNFQKEAQMSFRPLQLIPGLAAILQLNTVGEHVEAIIPASLGYGYVDYAVPAGSTLIFSYTIEKIEQ